MSNLTGINMKFIVVLQDTVDKHLTPLERSIFCALLAKIEDGRREAAGSDYSHTYLVINADEPYADSIIDILKANGSWGDS